MHYRNSGHLRLGVLAAETAASFGWCLPDKRARGSDSSGSQQMGGGQRGHRFTYEIRLEGHSVNKTCAAMDASVPTVQAI